MCDHGARASFEWTGYSAGLQVNNTGMCECQGQTNSGQTVSSFSSVRFVNVRQCESSGLRIFNRFVIVESSLFKLFSMQLNWCNICNYQKNCLAASATGRYHI